MKKLLIIAFLFVAVSSYSQTELTGYSNYAIGVKQNFSKRLSAEIKIFTNTGGLQYSAFDLSLLYGFKPGEYHRFSMGFGVSSFPFDGGLNSFFVPLVLEIYPVKELKRFSLVIELAPEFDAAEFLNLQQLWGIRYSFGQKD